MQPCTAVKVQICSKKVVTVPKIGVRVDRGSLNNGMEGELSKVLSSGVKSTQDALVVNLSVPLPSEDGEGQGMSSGVRGMVLQSSAAAAAHSHSSNHTLRRGNCTDPTHTRYWLEFYFYLQQELITSTSILPFSYLGGGDSDIGVVQPPFTWSIPLDVFATSGVGESLQNLQPLHVSGTAQMYVKN
jgi:hypothetical protein